MKHIQRLVAPACLGQLQSGRDDWKTVDKDALWLVLDPMQNCFCAYCECHLKDKHIEHFRTRNRFPSLTFDWNNLFGSCGNPQLAGQSLRCGIYKDRSGHPQYDPNDLIKPDTDDPSHFLIFLTSGVVRARNDLSPSDKRKAEETIRVFNLNGNSELMNRRKNAIKPLLDEIKTFYDLKSSFTEEEWDEYLQSQLEQLCDQEFSTALTHAWRFNEQY